MKPCLLFLTGIIFYKTAVSQVYEPVKDVYMKQGSCNTYLVKTSEGYALIDPGSEGDPGSEWLKDKVDSVKVVLLTHGHPDHTQYANRWSELGIPVYSSKEYPDFQHYETRLSGFYAKRNSIQGAPVTCLEENPGNYKARIPSFHFFDSADSVSLGGVYFYINHVGGETPDQSYIWVPEKKSFFIGDNYYTSFPNLYTLRGTRTRWALDYIAANEAALDLKAEAVFPGHDQPLIGYNNVNNKVSKYRDAIQYVHDETVKGMNEGKDVYTLMRAIRLPDSLTQPEFYGKVSWSVRGIYEGYAGWFNGSISQMYTYPASFINKDIVRLAGGTEMLIAEASTLFEKNEEMKALLLTDIIIDTEPDSDVIELRLKILNSLRSKSTNYIELKWLDHEIQVLKNSKPLH